jgi:hypothetical protein
MLRFMRVCINAVSSVKLLFQNNFKIAACLAAFNAVVKSESPYKLALTRLKNLSAEGELINCKFTFIVCVLYKAPL